MLRVELHDATNALIMRLEGRFTVEYADDVQALAMRCNTQIRLVVDLTEVSFVDSVGEAVLLWLRRIGAKFVSENAYTLDICERLQLPQLSDTVPGALSR